MATSYSSELKAHVFRDEGGGARHVLHSQEFWLSEEDSPRAAANAYLEAMAETLQIPREQLAGLHTRAQHDAPAELGIELQLAEEKQLFDSTTVSYAQTVQNIPVFRRGVAVQVKQGPSRVVGSSSNLEQDLTAEIPADKHLEPYRKAITNAAVQRERRRHDQAHGDGRAMGTDDTTPIVRKILGATGRKAARREDHARLLSGKFFVYRYVPENRFAGRAEPPSDAANGAVNLEEGLQPSLEIPPVATSIEPGRGYLVAEMIFRYDLSEYGELVWRALVEPSTDSILYLECMTCGVHGLVFKRDPMVSSGDLTVTSDDSNAVLESHDSDEVLNALAVPMGGTQSLSGTYVVIAEEESPAIAAPTQPSGVDFDYQPRTDEFAAVNAYYHQTELFRTIESLGFPIATYFDGTTFPIPVDHRGLGNVINAHWAPNGVGGTDHMCYALCDTTNTAQPLGRAVDPWVHWHEMGGHGALGDHVGSGLLGFAHSAGDGLAAIQMDPDSALRGVPERFRYAPFRPFTTERRFDRPAATWAWGSVNDDQNYGSEQILATCHFRLYRAIGGDHPDLGRRRFASRAATYLILRTIGNLTPSTNPSNWDPVSMTNVPGRGAQLWCDAMQAADLQDWTSEGLAGGAYNKVARWAFEKQGSYAGAPPAVDVYIDDGRGGEYGFQHVHWHNTSMWNRNAPDGLPGHQNAVAGATNYMYVKVKNRGTSAAGTVTVKGYHCLPGAGLTWPTDFTAMSPAAGLSVAGIGPNNSQEAVLGPFEWQPNENVYGHDCVLMIASTAGDASNVANFGPGETIEEWRLVPHDNNIGQRNVAIVPGGGGPEALLTALDGAIFVAGHSGRRRAVMHVETKLPRALAARDWRIEVGEGKFRLKPGQQRKLKIRLVTGGEFSPEELMKDRDIRVDLYADGVLVGGMTYRIDPELKEPSGGKRSGRGRGKKAARRLLDDIDMAVGDEVTNVRVTNIKLDVELGGKG